MIFSDYNKYIYSKIADKGFRKPLVSTFKSCFSAPWTPTHTLDFDSEGHTSAPVHHRSTVDENAQPVRQSQPDPAVGQKNPSPRKDTDPRCSHCQSPLPFGMSCCPICNRPVRVNR